MISAKKKMLRERLENQTFRIDRGAGTSRKVPAPLKFESKKEYRVLFFTTGCITTKSIFQV